MMKLIGLFLLTIIWLGLVFVDSGSKLTLDMPQVLSTHSYQNFDISNFISMGVVPILYGWSVFLALTALINMQQPKKN